MSREDVHIPKCTIMLSDLSKSKTEEASLVHMRESRTQPDSELLQLIQSSLIYSRIRLPESLMSYSFRCDFTLVQPPGEDLGIWKLTCLSLMTLIISLSCIWTVLTPSVALDK